MALLSLMAIIIMILGRNDTVGESEIVMVGSRRSSGLGVENAL
jgi:hypothetical protein